MNPNTDTPPADAPSSEAPEAAPRKKPRLALALATSFGLGYLPKAPGTWGSLAGIALAWLSSTFWFFVAKNFPSLARSIPEKYGWLIILITPSVVAVAVAVTGVIVASRVANYAGIEDPQYVVIDEVSGQFFTLLLPMGFFEPKDWKYLLLGFILFRVFDIWKPFPVRQLEKLPGGWGIMADDWMAAVYAALVLRFVIHLRWI